MCTDPSCGTYCRHSVFRIVNTLAQTRLVFVGPSVVALIVEDTEEVAAVMSELAALRRGASAAFSQLQRNLLVVVVIIDLHGFQGQGGARFRCRIGTDGEDVP